MYVNAQGQTVTAEEAAPGGVMRDGYRLHYNPLMMDNSRSGGTVFINDAGPAPMLAADRQMQIMVDAAHEHAAKQRRNEQAVTDAMRELGNGSANPNAIVRDMARDAFYHGTPGTSAGSTTAADRAGPADGAAMRDLARASQY